MSTVNTNKQNLREKILENAGMIAIMGLVFAAVPLLTAWSVKGLIQIF
ncbi:MAG: hypothetical protein HQL64_03560 [Magnetococcales bacterium]|nr:hypothetical protein [Magnetococcales bacterium]